MILKLAIGIILFFAGCTSNIPTPIERKASLLSLSSQSFFSIHTIQTKSFDIFSSSSNLAMCSDETLHVYIEGDGLAWITSRKISPDPTPLNPLAFKLALQDSNKCVLYLARPCQYNNTKECSKKYWTSHRFSKRVINNYDELLDRVKEKYTIKDFILFGYSGGGAIATLVASGRKDIHGLVTIAGNLDTKHWTKKHHITPLHGSLNPADYTNTLESLPQYHFIGENDKIVDISVYKSYASRFKNKDNLKYKVIKNNTHSKGWEKSWKQLLMEID